MGETRMRGVVGATVAGIVDRLKGNAADAPGKIDLDDVSRLEGLTVMVTGASSGLGAGIARHVADLGASVVLAQRSRHDESVRAVVDATGNGDVRALPLDLADPASITALAERLAADGVVLDRLVCNAGLVPSSARQTAAGIDVMVHVNFLGNVMLVDALLEHGVLRPAIGDGPRPRIVVVGSETHRSAPPIDLDSFATPGDYPTSKVVAHYGRSKLLLHTWAQELSRRLVDADGTPTVEVHHLCPGAVNSSLAREAPNWLQPVVGLAFKAFFQDPYKAARPVVWLAANAGIAGQTGIYLHLDQRKAPSDLVLDVATGAALWDRAHELADRISS
jgi:NAD(P)-dependent dehydrogenase (short-subunit alcohol dehydrogenase family)